MPMGMTFGAHEKILFYEQLRLPQFARFLNLVISLFLIIIWHCPILKNPVARAEHSEQITGQATVEGATHARLPSTDNSMKRSNALHEQQ